MSAHTVVHAQLLAEAERPEAVPPRLPMVSSHFCGGIYELWHEIWRLAPPSTKRDPDEAVQGMPPWLRRREEQTPAD